MKSAAILCASLASLALAQPHGSKHAHRHAHARAFEKRGLVTEWVTETEVVTVTEYIDETMTTWITAGVTAKTTSSSTSGVAGQFFEGASSAPSVPETSAAPVYVPPTTSQAPVVVETPTYTPPVESPAATVAAAPPVETQASGGSGSNKPSGQTFSGKMTYYDLGQDACGGDETGQDKLKSIVALSHIDMGELSNSNPLCGKTITISYGGMMTTAIIRDKCMGCISGEIDVSRKTFIDLTGEDKMIQDGHEVVEWWYN